AGHINPALSVASAIRKSYPEVKLCFAGNPEGMEARLVPQAGFDFMPFNAMGIQRKLTPYNIYRNIKSVGLLFTAAPRSKKLLREFGPNVVVGTGGYVSGPILMEAAELGIKTVTHEQNAFPGVTTKLLSKHVDKVLVAVEKAGDYLDPSVKYIVTGNPVRTEILTAQRQSARRELGIDEDKFCILSFGGSLGAQRVNEAIAEVMAWHVPLGTVHHIHATGQYGVELLPELLEKKNVAYKNNPSLDIREYIDNMPICLSAADIVICRAGAITLSELQAAGRASILVPSPNVAENHQYHNAMVMVNNNAARILEEKDLTGESLTAMVRELQENPQLAYELGRNARKMAITGANNKIMEEILALL
ncbi:MAG: UDP-N-acetylglucosamine--N-acetylmuramyl-(pentapeptide) pyrophosphoryl-undecaprenol N-acetylglucosamine transferase, partial [Angelakisella sp.]